LHESSVHLGGQGTDFPLTIPQINWHCLGRESPIFGVDREVG